MAKIIDGLAIAKKINNTTARKVNALKQKGLQPRLAVILVGDDPASAVYVRQKEKLSRQVGVDFVLRHFSEKISRVDLIANIKEIQRDKNLSGLIIQLPLPENLYCPEVLNAINTNVDVDFLSEASIGKILMGTNELEPPTPGAIMEILRELKVNLKGKNITIVGMGTLVGKPLAMLLEHTGASITTCNSKTKNIPDKCRQADIVVSCVGKKDLIRGDMVKRGAIVIDAGFSFYKGKSYGDINFEEVAKMAKYVTPTPGGVGPITVALLLKNTVACGEKNYNQ